MTSPSSSDGPEHSAPQEPLPPTADEPLPPDSGAPQPAGRSASASGADENPPASEVLVSRRAPLAGPAAASVPDNEPPANGNSFAAGFAREHLFSGARFLKPGRRVAVAVAAVVGITAIAVGVTAGVSQLGGGSDHPDVQSAASSRPLATASGTGAGGGTSPSGHPGATTPGKKPVGNSPAAPPAGGVVPPVAGAPLPPGAPLVGSVANPGTTGNAANSGSTGSTGTGSSGTTGTTTQGAVPPPANPPATSAPITFTGGLVLNFGSSNRCLATKGGSRAAGTQLVLADCNRNDPSQGWTFPSDGTSRDFGGTMCLDVSSASNGTLVRLAKCSSSRRNNQRFLLKNSYDLVDSYNPDYCVDAKDQGTAAGTVLQLWACGGTGNQKWKMA